MQAGNAHMVELCTAEEHVTHMEQYIAAEAAATKELQGQVARLQAELGSERERREGEGAAADLRQRDGERRIAEVEAELEAEREQGKERGREVRGQRSWDAEGP